ncbi:hypothetical protein ISN45_Aa08g009160 [Arabidopsis thaliana x Arabidopsis arenosa]|uniref:Uncharacterized protein n=1 Tax=Arabidopsis thaliana x Arabidopsis arenosa TaxID=1240361 RepID=A0A8T1XFN3_9BRAS|nr:hypothetical protein ISN45_Aa08g009160 [Arabidopsis thaliana x Arabidopsis arenosa]
MVRIEGGEEAATRFNGGSDEVRVRLGRDSLTCSLSGKSSEEEIHASETALDLKVVVLDWWRNNSMTLVVIVWEVSSTDVCMGVSGAPSCSMMGNVDCEFKSFGDKFAKTFPNDVGSSKLVVEPQHDKIPKVVKEAEATKGAPHACVGCASSYAICFDVVAARAGKQILAILTELSPYMSALNLLVRFVGIMPHLLSRGAESLTVEDFNEAYRFSMASLSSSISVNMFVRCIASAKVVDWLSKRSSLNLDSCETVLRRAAIETSSDVATLVWPLSTVQSFSSSRTRANVNICGSTCSSTPLGGFLSSNDRGKMLGRPCILAVKSVNKGSNELVDTASPWCDSSRLGVGGRRSCDKRLHGWLWWWCYTRCGRLDSLLIQSFCHFFVILWDYRLHQCPHHGFKKASLLNTLYRGALPKIRMLLDTASDGNFLNKDAEEGCKLVENLAQSDGNYNEDFDRSNRSTGDADAKHKNEIKALNKKLDMLLLGQQKHVHFLVDDDQYQAQDGEGNQLEEISYINNQGGYKGYNNFKPYNPNLSYRSTNVPKPQDQNPSPGFAPQQHQASAAPDQDMKQMLQQLLQGQASSAMILDKKLAEMNTKMDCSYNDLNIKFEASNSKIKYMENQTASTSTPKHPGQFPGKAVQNTKDYANVHAITLQSGREVPTREATKPVTKDSELQDGEDLRQSEAPIDKSVKDNDLIMERIKEVTGMVVLSHECSAIIQKKIIPKKLGDPGSFTLPCSLGPLVFNKCLCDLGESVSLMPLSIAKRLEFSKYKSCNISLILADRSVRIPHGLLEDLPIRIGVVDIPTDFVVLEMDEEPQDLLILGRPFLAIAGAIIDCRRGKIDLNLGKDLKMAFDVTDSMSALTKYGEDGYLHLETSGYKKLLDSHKEAEGPKFFEELIVSPIEVLAVIEESSDCARASHSTCSSSSRAEESEDTCSTKVLDQPSTCASDDWSELKALKADLKPLPKGLRYAFLGTNSTYPVIINAELNDDEVFLGVKELWRSMCSSRSTRPALRILVRAKVFENKTSELNHITRSLHSTRALDQNSR